MKFKLVRIDLFAMAILIALLGCQQRHVKDSIDSPSISKDFKATDHAFNFYVLGDWGRNGDFHQKDLAETMNRAADIMEPELIISTGDNFYPDGVISIQDPLWKSSFEDIYTGHGLMAPWYIVLGNHDYHGNPQAEVEYTKVSQRWNMPSRYYVVDKDVSDETLKLIFIDTSPLEDDYYNEEYKDAVAAQDTTKQLLWIDSVLTKSTARWNIVVGHHPLYTGGKRAEEHLYSRNHLEKIFIKHKVDAYFCGHEHDLQHIKPEGATHYFISGAGSEVRPTGKLPITKFAESIQGFMAVSVTKDSMQVQVVDYEGNLRYRTAFTK